MINHQKKLILAGTGIKSISHMTNEVQSCIEKADVVLYLVNEPLLKRWIRLHAQNAVSLDEIYFKYEERKESYKKITEEIIQYLELYLRVCVAIYGHPTVFASSGLEAIEVADKKGIKTSIMPAVSAEDCLFADLRLDPSDGGCYSIEATQFILENKFFDPSSHVIIWQIGMIGNLGQPSYQVNASAIQCLVRKLLKIYPKDFQAIIYEASVYPGLKPSIKRFKISTLYEQQLSPISTLYIPPLENKSINEAILREIGITKNSH